jgi:hypothetical protein
MHLCCARHAGTAAQQTIGAGVALAPRFTAEAGVCLITVRTADPAVLASGVSPSRHAAGDLFSACGPLDHGGFSHHNNKEYSGSSSAHLGWHAARPVISLCLRVFWLIGCWLGARNSSEASTTHAAAAAAAALPPAAAPAARRRRCHPPPPSGTCCPASCRLRTLAEIYITAATFNLNQTHVSLCLLPSCCCRV